MSVHYSIETISSDKDTNFTAALAQNAIENESLSFPSDYSTVNIIKLKINSIAVQADFTNTATTLDFEVVFWNTDGYSNADLDTDGYIASVLFSNSDARQIAGTGQYYYESENSFKSPIYYEDADGTGELHVGLVNRSATTFHADDTIKLSFVVEPIL